MKILSSNFRRLEDIVQRSLKCEIKFIISARRVCNRSPNKEKEGIYESPNMERRESVEIGGGLKKFQFKEVTMT